MSYNPGHLRRHHLPLARRTLKKRLPKLARDYAYAFRYGVEELRVRLRNKDLAQPADGLDVIVLTGLWEPHAFIHPILQALRSAGFRTHEVKGAQLNLLPLDVLASRVADFLEDSELDDVVVVAHSKGGLVAKQLLIDERTAGLVRGAVAIATPFSGSELAGLAPDGLGVRSLLPGSEMLRELDEHPEVNRRIVCLYPEDDPVVPGGGRLEGAHNVELGSFGHFKFLTDERVQVAIVKAVEWLAEHPEGEVADEFVDLLAADEEG